MSTWFRFIILLALLLIITAGAGWTSRTPRLGHTSPSAPRLVSSGSAPLEVSAEAVLIERLRTGEVLFARNSERLFPIASLTKLVTALLLVESEEPLAEITFSPDAKKVGEPEDKRSAVTAGEHVRAEDVLKMLLISSDSDAAYAAAGHVAVLREPALAGQAFTERIAAFVGLMNDRARALELADTHFANPAGSDDPANYSSARDLVRLAEIITRTHPELWTISRTAEAFIFSRSGRRYGLINTNPLLREYPALYGSKTGFEDAAKGALLLVYRLAREEPFVIVLLRSKDRIGDGRAAIGWLEANFVLSSP